MNKLIKLEEFNSRFPKYVNLNEPRVNGIACPECGSELYDSSPNVLLTSNPPQKHIHCKCGYKGLRNA